MDANKRVKHKKIDKGLSVKRGKIQKPSFGFTSDWVRKWHKIFLTITESS